MATSITVETAQWVAGLLQTADSFYPTGGYAHSHGLEGLVQSGVVHDCATLRTFLFEYVLPALARTDLPLAVQAWAAAGTAPDWTRLRELCFLGAALRGAREPREAPLAHAQDAPVQGLGTDVDVLDALLVDRHGPG